VLEQGTKIVREGTTYGVA